MFPYPVLHPGMNKYTRSGLYVFIAYYYASLNYFYAAGDTEPLSKIVKPEDVIEPEILRLYQEKRGWLVADGDVYENLSISRGSFYPNVEFKSTKRNIFEFSITDAYKSKTPYFFVPETGERFNLENYKPVEETSPGLYVENLKGRWVLINNGKDLMPLYPPGFHKIRY